MKKLYILFLFCFINIMQADQLSDAIRQSDVEEVSILLSQQKLTAAQLLKYVDTAERVIYMRRNNPSLGFISSKDLAKYRNPYQVIGLASVGWFFIASGTLFGVDTFSDEVLTCAFVSLPLSLITLAACGIASDLICQKMHSDLHSNAITIKEMLYDYRDGVEIANNV